MIKRLKPFSPSVFFGIPKTLSTVVGALSKCPVKKDGLGQQNLVTPANDKCNSLICASCKPIGAVMGERLFQPMTTFVQLKKRGGIGKTIGVS